MSEAASESVLIGPGDIENFASISPEKLSDMIEDAIAMASLAAPCIHEEAFLVDKTRVSQVRAVLRGAILRWNEAGSGAAAQMASGPFQATMDTRQPRKAMFWPSELSQLRDICSQFKNESKKQKAFSIDTAPVVTGEHSPYCNINRWFGGPSSYCSCGSDLNADLGPLWEREP